MSGLRRPISCLCGSANLKYGTKPERWDCLDCNTSAIRRRRCQEDIVKLPKPHSHWVYDPNNEPNTCTHCGRSKKEVKISRTKRRGCVCLECFIKKDKLARQNQKTARSTKWLQRRSASHKRWRSKNYSHLTKVRHRKAQETPNKFIKHILHNIKRRTKRPRQGEQYVDNSTNWSSQTIGKRNSEQSCPESFIKAVWGQRRRYITFHLKTGTNRKGDKLMKQSKHEITIDTDYLISLWKSQKGKCAITNMPMAHKFKNLRSISVDRIDSAKGYIIGNVQLVCQWVNLAKGSHSDDEFRKIIKELALIKTPRKTTRA